MADKITNEEEEIQFDKEGKPIIEENKPPVEGEKEDPAPKIEDQKDDEEEIVIPVRNSAAQHIIARKNEKIKKLESKIKENEDYKPPVEDEEDDSGLSEEAKLAVQREIEKRVAPLLGKYKQDEEEKELQTLMQDEPEAKNFEKHIRAYMQHEAYKNVAPSVIYHHLAFANAEAKGAKKKKAADFEAKQYKSGGRPMVDRNENLSGLPSAEDITGMTDAEFEKLESEARQGKYLKR